jgi:curli biogenesis system outer membrane secretion channel CsgG
MGCVTPSALPRVVVALTALCAGCLPSFPTSTYVNPSSSFDSEKRVAILPFEARHGNGQAMADAFVTQFMSAGFTVVDRNVVEGVAKNLGLDLSSPVLQPDELSKLAERSKVDAFVFGTINAESERQGGLVHSVSVRIVHARSSEVILSSTFKNEKELPAFQIPQAMMSNIARRVKKSVKSKRKEEAKKASVRRNADRD